jgi:hypothetical protein
VNAAPLQSRPQSSRPSVASVPKLWPGETFVCIGSGPSLTREDVDYCRGKARVIVVNNGYQLAPWADVLYACDTAWWRVHHGVPDFQGLKYSLSVWPGVQTLRNTGPCGLDLDPTGLRTGRNSGYQAINLAVHLGARRILLLGYDMHPGPKGQQHWHPDHPQKTTSPYAAFRMCFTTIVKPLADLGIEMVNCSRATALESWPRLPIEQALP